MMTGVSRRCAGGERGFSLGSAAERVGLRLKVARKELGWRPERMAAELDVSARTLYRWERGEATPPLEALMRVAVASGRDLTWFAS